MAAGVVLVIGVAAGARAAPPSAALVGGVAVAEDPGPVGAIVDAGGAVVCTAFLLHPRWMLTAAHCVDAAPDRVWFGTDLVGGAPSLEVDVVSVVVDPAYADQDTHDLALLELAVDVARPLAALVDGTPAADDTLTAFGYGVTFDGGTDGGVLREVDLDVIEVQEGVLRTYAPGANLCSGDSGGPLVLPGTLAVAGVAAFVDPTCAGGTGGATRSDLAYGFAAAYIDGLLPADVPEDTGYGGPTTGTTTNPPPPTTTGTTDTTDGDWDVESDGATEETPSARGHLCATDRGGSRSLLLLGAIAAAVGRRRGTRAPRAAADSPHS